MTDFLTLSQLNTLVSDELKLAFPETYWLMAETSDVRVHANRHCYLEFIEKDGRTGSIIAKARGYIWNSTFELLKPYFEQKTGQLFTSGIKVLVRVSVEFHPLYGYGLNVCDIDPIYTMGDIQARRQEIISQLEEEGVLSLNKELDMPLNPQRIAVISSPTAAGYEDFLNHLNENKFAFIFYPHLFPAIMQGEQTENSIIAALDKIYLNKDQFDVVVIIRGGGASSDLASFDQYLLAANCAQFPLPIITGIGHERDDTVLDIVAHYRAKTPTAVADFLVTCMENALNRFLDCKERIIEVTNQTINSASSMISYFASYFPSQAEYMIEKQSFLLTAIQKNISKSTTQLLTNERSKLIEKESFFKLSSPEYILSKGYSITLKNGKTVRSFSELDDNDLIETVLADGKVKSVVRK